MEKKIKDWEYIVEKQKLCLEMCATVGIYFTKLSKVVKFSSKYSLILISTLAKEI